MTAGDNSDSREGQRVSKALAMLNAFASVVARVFDLSITDLNGKKVEGLQRPGRSLDEMRRMTGPVLQD